MRKLLVFLVAIFLIPNVLAQENEVCLVYFTRNNCDECGLTETHIDGLINEYSHLLTVIKYNIDNSQENRDIFEAYRNTYDLPSDVPMVLFGEDNYLLKKDDIYKNTEAKILSFLGQNGTNCPLESGYVPPSSLNPSDLPGQAEVFESEGLGEGPEEEGEGEGVDGDETETFIPDIGGAIQSMIKDVVESEHFYDWLIVTAAFIILIFGVSLLFVRKKVK